MTKKMISELEEMKNIYLTSDICEDILLKDEEIIITGIMKCDNVTYEIRRKWMKELLNGYVTVHTAINRILNTTVEAQDEKSIL